MGAGRQHQPRRHRRRLGRPVLRRRLRRHDVHRRRRRRLHAARRRARTQGFEGADYGAWTTTGTAFGTGRRAGTLRARARRRRVRGQAARQQLPRRAIARTGTLTSPAFTIDEPVPELHGRRRQPPARPGGRSRRPAAARRRSSPTSRATPTARLDGHRHFAGRRPAGRHPPRPAAGVRLRRQPPGQHLPRRRHTARAPSPRPSSPSPPTTSTS